MGNGIDSVDKIIWILPFLSIADVLSTLYVESLGYSLQRYEAGLFAHFFVASGLTYFYGVIYVSTVAVLSYAVWDIKNKKLDPSYWFDKILFLFLVGFACFTYARITLAFIMNVLFPFFIEGTLSLVFTTWLVIVGLIFSLGFYIWHDVIMWVKTHGNERQQLP